MLNKEKHTKANAVAGDDALIGRYVNLWITGNAIMTNKPKKTLKETILWQVENTPSPTNSQKDSENKKRNIAV
jgi:hypothetical protein